MVALAITLVLIFYPRSSDTTAASDDIDTLFIVRTVLLLVLLVSVVIGLIMVLVLHLMDPIKAGPLQRIKKS